MALCHHITCILSRLSLYLVDHTCRASVLINGGEGRITRLPLTLLQAAYVDKVEASVLANGICSVVLSENSNAHRRRSTMGFTRLNVYLHVSAEPLDLSVSTES